MYQPRRGRVVASRGETEVTIRREHVQFRGCSLPFKTARFVQRVADSVRIIRVRDWSGQSELAAAFPPDLQSVKAIVESFPMHQVWSSSEGIVTTCEGPEPRFYWRLPKSREVCRAWLGQYGFALAVTPAGELLVEAVRQLGGFHGVWLFANEDLIRLLRNMAGRRNEPGQTYTGSQLVQTIEKTTRDRNRAVGILHRLIRSRVFEVGAVLQCEHCREENWYRLKTLSASLHCDRCLQDFNFPMEQPPNNPWRYRTIGPFAVENYIKGGMSVLLAMPILGGRGGSFPRQV